jgi:D-serine deaminase-like pyridoxal phosphate-dependent protein
VHSAYALSDVATTFTPALVFYPELIRRNIARVIEMAGSPDRLRPHAKTHKTREIARMLLDAGVTRHKCATIAEAEMLASIGTPDVLIAYPLVGPNIARLAQLIRTFPKTKFSTLIDHPDSARALSAGLSNAGASVGVILDLDVGQHRTGVPLNESARALGLYELASKLPGLTPNGFQVYDGHNNQPERAEREKGVREFIAPVLALRERVQAKGIAVPRLVCGGTPSLPVYAAMAEVPGIECSPGTFVLHDANYGPRYEDLAGITPAAVLLTRVVSRPSPDRVTLDLGSKAVASDPPMENRATLLDFPEYKIVGHNEEHLVVEVAGAAADGYKPGDVVYALPGHVCPTVALHKEALIAEGGKITGRWQVAARDRMLSV